MASGKPVICTELQTGTSFVNLHRKTGIVVPPRDPSALEKAILSLLGNDTLRLEMGERGKKRAIEEFSLNTMVERVMNLYESLASG